MIESEACDGDRQGVGADTQDHLEVHYPGNGSKADGANCADRPCYIGVGGSHLEQMRDCVKNFE